MAVFAIMSEAPEPKLAEALEAQYSGRLYRWSDRVVVLSTGEEPQAIAAKLGVQRRSADGEIIPGIRGVFITKLAPAYYGWSGKNFWEWLKNAHQEEGA